MSNQNRRSDRVTFSLPIITNENFNPHIEQNFQDFIYRDTISRKQYVFGTLKQKKVKLTISRRKNPRSESKPIIRDDGGHLQILSNIKQYRFNELLRSSKSMNKLKEEIERAELSKYNQYKESLLKIRANMINQISNYNMGCFRKYMTNEAQFDSKLSIMKRIQNQKISQQQLQKFMKSCNNEDTSEQFSTLEVYQKKKVRNEVLQKQLDSQFENKYRKQYDILEADIKNKINGQVKYLVQPDEVNYKSVKPSINNKKKTSMNHQLQFERHVEQIRDRSLSKKTNLNQVQNSKIERDEQSVLNFQFLKSLIEEDNTFELQCELNEHPQFVELVDHRGNTLLHIAAKQSRVDACKILMSKKIDATAKNELGQTPAKIAQHFNEHQIMILIQKYNNRYIDNY